MEPGSVHDITAARAHALPALYPAAAGGMVTLADKGYVGAGIGIKTPIKGSKPDPGARSYNQVQAHLRPPAEEANALLKGLPKPSNQSPSTQPPSPTSPPPP